MDEAKELILFEGTAANGEPVRITKTTQQVRGMRGGYYALRAALAYPKEV